MKRILIETMWGSFAILMGGATTTMFLYWVASPETVRLGFWQIYLIGVMFSAATSIGFSIAKDAERAFKRRV